MDLAGADPQNPDGGQLGIQKTAVRLLEAAIVVAAIATIPIVIELERGVEDPMLGVLDWVIWSVFLTDYVILGMFARDKDRYLRQNWIGLAIVVLSFPPLPVILDVVRLARLARMLRLLRLVAVIIRGIYALRAALARPGLIYVALVTTLLVLSSAGLLTMIEPETVKYDYWTGVWWAVVTTTTVGYGDVTPVSPAGRVLAGILMIAGMGLVATLAASIAAHFVAQDELKQEKADFNALIKRLDSLERLVKDLSDRTARDK